MEYGTMICGTFVSRPNRFIAMVLLEDRLEPCHVKNTGRCRELLKPGVRVWVSESDRPGRKTRYSLITVEKTEGENTRLVNLDSQAPNQVADEWLRAHQETYRWKSFSREKTYGDSRFDFCLEWEDGSFGYWEVKGVTLEENGIARFPDAPTERGLRHVHQLTEGQRQGLCNGILFVIQMKGVRKCVPNWETQEEFGLALQEAAAAGVRIMAIDCQVEIDRLTPDSIIPVDLERSQEQS